METNTYVLVGENWEQFDCFHFHAVINQSLKNLQVERDIILLFLFSTEERLSHIYYRIILKTNQRSNIWVEIVGFFGLRRHINLEFINV